MEPNDSTLGPVLREQIGAVLAGTAGAPSLAVQHAVASRSLGIDAAELERNRDGYAAEPRVAAAIRFAHAALITRGRVDERDRRALRKHGFTAAQETELVVLAGQAVSRAVLANYLETTGGR